MTAKDSPRPGRTISAQTYFDAQKVCSNGLMAAPCNGLPPPAHQSRTPRGLRLVIQPRRGRPAALWLSRPTAC